MGGLATDGDVVYEYLDQEEADFFYHEIFVFQNYFQLISEDTKYISANNNKIINLYDNRSHDNSGHSDDGVDSDLSVARARQVIHLKDGDFVIDIGANIGLFSLYCLSRHQNLRLIACEPIPPLFTVLRRNLQCYRQLHEVHLLPKGVGRVRNEEAVFVYHEQAPGESCQEVYQQERADQRAAVRVASLEEGVQCEALSSGGQSHQCRYQCPVCPLQEVLASVEGHEGAMIDLLKVDCEGAELEVLLGIREDCLWRRIRQLVIEVHDLPMSPPSDEQPLEKGIPGGRLQRVVSVLKERGHFDEVIVQQQTTQVCRDTGYVMFVPDNLHLYYVFGTLKPEI